MKLAADICQKLALIKEAAMSAWAAETGLEPAVARWQDFVKNIPRDTPYDNLPAKVRQEIEYWLNKQ